MNTPEAVTGCILSCVTGQKMKFSMKDFFSKCDRISGFLRIWSHLLKKSLMENFIFCAVSSIAYHFEKSKYFILSHILQYTAKGYLDHLIDQKAPLRCLA